MENMIKNDRILEIDTIRNYDVTDIYSLGVNNRSGVAGSSYVTQSLLATPLFIPLALAVSVLHYLKEHQQGHLF